MQGSDTMPSENVSIQTATSAYMQTGMENEREVSANGCATQVQSSSASRTVAADPEPVVAIMSLAELPESRVTRGGNGNVLLRQPSMLHELRQSCALRGQRVASCGKMKNHYHQSHAAIMTEQLAF